MNQKDIVILREHELLKDTSKALASCMHTQRMTYANWAYAYQQVCDLLGVDSGIEIREILIENYKPNKDTHRIIINGSRESNLNIEDLLHEKFSSVIDRCVNPSGERLLKKLIAEGHDPADLDRLLGKGYTIFANNKVLSYQALNQGDQQTIPMLGYGHRNPALKGKGIKSDLEKVVIKPVDRSHGEGIEFVSGNEIDIVHNPNAIFGTHMVQQYVSTPEELRYLHRELKGINNPKLNLNTDLRVMVTELDNGYGAIGHIRVAINRNGKANLSQDASSPEERAYAIGLNPKIPITDSLDREICIAYGIDPDKPKVPKHIARHSAALANKFGRPLLGTDYGLTSDQQGLTLKLFEANVTPGSAIYSYYGATMSEELGKFVQEQKLGKYVDNVSIDQLSFDRDEIARHRTVNILCKTRAFLRTRVDKAMKALGLDNSIYGGDYKW